MSPPDAEAPITAPLDDTVYDPLAVGAYAEHLSEVNDTKRVIAGADILNSQGILLIKKGQPISKEMVARIVQFKLLRPLESSIDIEDSLTAEKLIIAIENSFYDRNTRDFYTKYLRSDIVDCCRQVFQYPLLGQKLTVLSIRMPQEFNMSLMVAWSSLAITLWMHLPKADRVNLFIAALMHDIGMLHINREIITKEGSLTPEEWRSIKSHPIIGQKILEQVQGLPPTIAMAVREHHEMSDGTGYPVGKFGHELNVAGQVVGILDSVFAIFFNKLAPKGLSTRSLIPILQMNSSSYRQDVHNAVINSLREFKHADAAVVSGGENANFLAAMIADAALLNNYHTQLTAINKILETGVAAGKRIVRAAQTMSEQLHVLLRRSGILDENYFSDMLQSLKTPTQQFEAELEEAHLMLQELRWKLVKLTRIYFSIAEDESALSPDRRALLLHAMQALPALNSR